MTVPLADRIRPKSISEVVGQKHLLSDGKPLKKIIDSGYIPNMIFYGPSGTGKTTVARIIAENTDLTMYKLNGTSATTSDIKAIISETGMFTGVNGILIYLDEIQYLNKKQQQSLLEYIENGQITLIASTTENPYFSIFNAILSRSTVFEFKPPEASDVIDAVKRAIYIIEKERNAKIKLDEGVSEYISRTCGGDVRKAINTVELSVISGEIKSDEIYISMETVAALAQRSNMKYDRDGDQHYDILSALQKSIRGSDENAALHYAARLICAGDIISLSRRLLVIASEDIGLAYPQAVTIVKSCVDSAMQLGLPEARIPLAQAVLVLTTAPKSNSVITSIDEAIYDINNKDCGDIPANLKDGHYSGAEKLGNAKGYVYPHDYPDNYYKQQYLPNNLKDKVYYKYGHNKQEQAALQYWSKIKKGK